MMIKSIERSSLFSHHYLRKQAPESGRDGSFMSRFMKLFLLNMIVPQLSREICNERELVHDNEHIL